MYDEKMDDEFSLQNCEALLKIAFDLEFTKLMRHLKTFLQSRLSIDNTLTFICLADTYYMFCLRKKAILLIVMNPEHFTKQLTWNNLIERQSLLIHDIFKYEIFRSDYCDRWERTKGT
jgi:hypothetical protein